MAGKPKAASNTRLALQLDRIEAQLQQLDQLARYGTSAGILTDFLRSHDEMKIRAHCHAGRLTISPLLFDNLPHAAHGFYQLFKDATNQIQLTEHHVVDKFLLNLIKALPNGSVWLGITRLQSPDAWRKGDVHIDYWEFQQTAEARIKNRELNYFRLWSLKKERHLHDIEQVMARQSAAGFHIRYAVGNSNLKDISLLWVPKDGRAGRVIKNVASPSKELEEHWDPLCVIEFEPRGGKDLDEMTISSPSTDQFKDLRRHFQRNWEDGRVLSVAKPSAFVIMPFTTELTKIYDSSVKPVVELSEFNLECRRADDFKNNKVILEDIVEAIYKARLIIAELSGFNPNVMYELGVAHANSKDTILICQRDASVKFPLDLAHIRRIEYTNDADGYKRLKKDLGDTIRQLLSKPV